MQEIYRNEFAGVCETASAVDEPGTGNACHVYRIEAQASAGPVVSFSVSFQHGPIGEVGVNGIQNESLIAICIHRLKGFQSGPYSCVENEQTLKHLEYALHHAKLRQADRVERGVEGSNQV